MNAYTYIIKCPNGKSYYGYRSANKVSPEDDLWKVYFTSSKRIKELRKQYDDADFVASVDKTFKTAEEAHEYETKFLTENDCVHSDDWLNEHCFPVFAMTEETKKKLSEAGKVRRHPEETKKKISESKMGHKHTEKSKKKMSEMHKGMKLTDEHKKNIGEGLKKHHAKEKRNKENVSIEIHG